MPTIRSTVVFLVIGCTATTASEGESATEATAEDTGASSDSGAESDTANDETGGPDCGAACDPWAPDCPDGEKCTAIRCGGEPETVCRPHGSAGVGETCSFVEGGLDECGPGLTCWNVQFATGTGRCVAWCEGSPTDPICGAPLRCDRYDDGLVPLCFTQCHPLDQDCPESTDACFPDFDPRLGAACAPPGTAQAGESCAFAGDCVAGSWCAPAEIVTGCALTLSCCTPLCDLEAPNTCPGAAEGELCLPLWDEAQVGAGWESIGLCRLP